MENNSFQKENLDGVDPEEFRKSLWKSTSPEDI